MSRNDALKVAIQDGVLVISIGVETLAKATQFCSSMSRFNEKTGQYDEPEITDPDKFALEVVTALNDEDEDGTTLVHQAIDKAAEQAIEMGAEGIRLSA